MLVVLSVVLSLAGLVGAGIILFRQPWFMMGFFGLVQHHQASNAPAEPPLPSGPAYEGPRLDATGLVSAADLFQPTNIWEAHLNFSAAGYEGLAPERIPPVPNWLAPDGTPTLRNPLASRAGVAGTLGFDLPWSRGDLRFGGIPFTNAAIRYKGNGTFLEAMQGPKKSFKINLADDHPGRSLAGQKTLNLHNLIADRSCLADTLGYEFYRDAGVPASLTTFARVFLTVEGRWADRLLGLYVLVENPDGRWARRALGTDGAVLFKPVGTSLFEDLGDAWEDYEAVYDPRSQVPEPFRQRLLGLCQLVSRADDAEFARRIGEFLDLDAVARYFACEVLLSNYDGILMNGQNFILWLDPRTERFGFSPWDLDHSWGEFGQVGTREQRETASVRHPWVGRQRFLERLFAAPAFSERYLGELARLRRTLFVPERLDRRIDALAATLRAAVAEQPGDRLAAFEHAVGLPPPDPAPNPGPDSDESRDRPSPQGHSLKRFIERRAASVDAQLAGSEQGVTLKRAGPW